MMKKVCTPVAAHRRWLSGCHKCSILVVTVHRYLHEVQWSSFAIAGEWC